MGNDFILGMVIGQFIGGIFLGRILLGTWIKGVGFATGSAVTLFILLKLLPFSP